MDYTKKYLKLKPRRTNILGIFRVLSSYDYTKECKDFIESVRVREEMLEQRGIVFASILAQKLLQYIEKPLALLGLGLEMSLNIFCNSTNFQLFFNNLFRGKVVLPSKECVSFVSIIGLIDTRVNLNITVPAAPSPAPASAPAPSPSHNHKYFATLTAMASKLAYENHQYIQTIVQNTWKMELLGSFSFWDEIYEGDTTQAFMFKDTTTDTIFVVFRGTEPFNAKDWITDCDISWCKLAGIKGRVHGGFVKALGLINHKTTHQNAYSTITQILKAHYNNNNNNEMNHATRLIVTGHSLGGALAVLFASALVMRGEARLLERLEAVYTFGQPRVGDAKFGKFMEEQFNGHGVEYYRFVYNHDIVPRLPFDSSALMFKHFGKCIYITSLYEAQIVEEEPLKNYFDWGSMVSKRVDAMWEVVRGFLLPRMFGADYKEGFVLVMIRMMGILFPGLPDHGLQDYINATRLATY